MVSLEDHAAILQRCVFLQPPAPPVPPRPRRGDPPPPPPVPVLSDEQAGVSWADSTVSPVVMADVQPLAFPPDVSWVVVKFAVTAGQTLLADGDIVVGFSAPDGTMQLGVSSRGSVVMMGCDDGTPFNHAQPRSEALFVVTESSIAAIHGGIIVGAMCLPLRPVSEHLAGLAPSCQFRGAPGSVSISLVVHHAVFRSCGRQHAEMLGPVAASIKFFVDRLVRLSEAGPRTPVAFRLAPTELQWVCRARHSSARDSFVAQCVMDALSDVLVGTVEDRPLGATAWSAAVAVEVLTDALTSAARSGSFSRELDDFLSSRLCDLVGLLRRARESVAHMALLRCVGSALEWRNVCAASLGRIGFSDAHVWRDTAAEVLATICALDEHRIVRDDDWVEGCRECALELLGTVDASSGSDVLVGDLAAASRLWVIASSLAVECRGVRARALAERLVRGLDGDNLSSMFLGALSSERHDFEPLAQHCSLWHAAPRLADKCGLRAVVADAFVTFCVSDGLSRMLLLILHTLHTLDRNLGAIDGLARTSRQVLAVLNAMDTVCTWLRSDDAETPRSCLLREFFVESGKFCASGALAHATLVSKTMERVLRMALSAPLRIVLSEVQYERPGVGAQVSEGVLSAQSGLDCDVRMSLSIASGSARWCFTLLEDDVFGGEGVRFGVVARDGSGAGYVYQARDGKSFVPRALAYASPRLAAPMHAGAQICFVFDAFAGVLRGAVNGVSTGIVWDNVPPASPLVCFSRWAPRTRRHRAVRCSACSVAPGRDGMITFLARVSEELCRPHAVVEESASWCGDMYCHAAAEGGLIATLVRLSGVVGAADTLARTAARDACAAAMPVILRGVASGAPPAVSTCACALAGICAAFRIVGAAAANDVVPFGLRPVIPDIVRALVVSVPRFSEAHSRHPSGAEEDVDAHGNRSADVLHLLEARGDWYTSRAVDTSVDLSDDALSCNPLPYLARGFAGSEQCAASRLYDRALAGAVGVALSWFEASRHVVDDNVVAVPEPALLGLQRTRQVFVRLLWLAVTTVWDVNSVRQESGVSASPVLPHVARQIRLIRVFACRCLAALVCEAGPGRDGDWGVLLASLAASGGLAKLSRMRALALPEYGCAVDAARILLAAFVPGLFLDSLAVAVAVDGGSAPEEGMGGIELCCVLRIWPRICELLVGGTDCDAALSERIQWCAREAFSARAVTSAVRVIARPPLSLPVPTRCDLLGVIIGAAHVLASVDRSSIYAAARHIAKNSSASLSPGILLDFARALLDTHIVALSWDASTVRGPLEVRALDNVAPVPGVQNLTAVASAVEAAQPNVRGSRGFDVGKVRVGECGSVW